MITSLVFEIKEDVILDKIAGERDTKDTRFLTHKQAWEISMKITKE